MRLMSLRWLLNLMKGLLNLMQGIEGSANAMNLHSLTCANATIQAVLGIKSESILLETNVGIMFPELW